MISSALWILAAMAAYGGLHSLLASHGWKRRVESWLGPRRYQRGYRLFFNVFGALSFLPVLFLLVRLPDRPLYTLPFPLWILTGALQLAGAAGMALAVQQTGAANFLGLEQWFSPQRAAQPHSMTTGGLYAYVRHPIYTCALIVLWLTPILTVNLLAFNLGATLYMTLGAAWFEEKKLAAEFGEAYTAYQKRVPMLIPRLGRRRS